MKNRFRTGLIAALCLCAGLLGILTLRTCSGRANEKELVSAAKADTCAVPDTVYLCDEVEEEPQFPGGFKKMLEYIARNQRLPEEYASLGCYPSLERVIVQFIVNKDGSLSDIEILKGLDPPLNKEAVRIIESMPRWTPGRQKGKVVRVRYVTMVIFRVW
ncbi:energy transducer TonB [Bacteroides sp. ET225]|uniref:energy transducer TonB n=1 Tax=Bacteroides sp. ET225 TaxID=2972461 RepID=UPI0021ACF413|nr:energy transducer TonB [Bacteroides sp. ET225]MCR8917073.1 energy transducer TonB [Bacteroides sp. ET225]